MYNDHENWIDTISSDRENFIVGLRSAEGYQLVSVQPFENDKIKFYWTRMKASLGDDLSLLRNRDLQEFLKNNPEIETLDVN